MAIVISYCPKCKNMLEVSTAYIAIGTPYEQCSKCKTLIRNGKVNEWKLLAIYEKVYYTLIVTWTGFMFGSVISAVGTYLLMMLLDLKIDDNLILQVAIVGAVIGILICYYFFYELIKESNTRMNDPDYILELKSIGLIESNIDKQGNETGFSMKYPTDNTKAIKGIKLWLGILLMIAVWSGVLIFLLTIILKLIGITISIPLLIIISITLPTMYYFNKVFR